MFRNATTLKGAKEWARCPPCPRLDTHIPNATFKTWLRFYIRNPIPCHTSCPSRNSPEPPDQYADHSFTWKYSTHIGRCAHTIRHDAIVRYITTEMKEAGRSTIVELRYKSSIAQPEPHSKPQLIGAANLEIPTLSTTTATTPNYDEENPKGSRPYIYLHWE